MKKNFLKVFSLLLVISMLAISVTAVEMDKPQSEITIAADPGPVVLCQGQGQQVTVTLSMPTCYGIGGQWEATGGLTLDTVTANNGKSFGATIAWADVDDENQSEWFKHPMTSMTATYTIPAGITAGEYTISFTCTLFAGGHEISENNPDIELWEGTFKYSATIQVVDHAYGDLIPAQDAIHNPTELKAGVAAHYQCSGCQMYFTEDKVETTLDALTGETPTHAFGDEWKTDENNHWHECACGAKNAEGKHDGDTATCTQQADCDTCGVAYGDKNASNHASTAVTYKNITDTTHDEYYACCDVLKSVGVAHDFTNGDCVCGAKKPVAVTAKGNISYTVEGQTVTVTHSAACKVGYWDVTTGKYITLTATKVSDNTYSFTAPEGVTEVLLVMKGDVTGDGRYTLSDTRAIAKSRLKSEHKNYAALTEDWQVFAADVTGDGRYTLSDTRAIAKSRLKETHKNFAPLTWDV